MIDAKMITAVVVNAVLNAAALFFIFAAGVPFARWLEKRGGLRSCMADVVKIITKNATGHTRASKPLAALAAILAVTTPLAAAACIPLFPSSANAMPHALPHESGIILICTCITLGSSIPLFAGWSSASAFSMLGGLRAPAQAMNHGLALLAALGALVFVTGSFDLLKIIAYQGNDPVRWFVIRQPVAFLIVVFSTLAASLRPPFDAPHCRRELIAGYMTDAQGVSVVLFTLAHYLMLVTGSLMISALFLGGGAIPSLPVIENALLASAIELIVIIVKTAITILVLSQVRRIVARLRLDQFLRVGWLIALPVAALNLLATIALHVGEF